MRSLSDSLTSTYKETIQESNIHDSSLRKVLKLFGYNNSYNNRFLKRINNIDTVLDIHKFNSILNEKYSFILCLEHNNNSYVKSGLLIKFRKQYFNQITTKILNIKNMNQVYDILLSIDRSSEIVMHYD